MLVLHASFAAIKERVKKRRHTHKLARAHIGVIVRLGLRRLPRAGQGAAARRMRECWATKRKGGSDNWVLTSNSRRRKEGEKKAKLEWIMVVARGRVGGRGGEQRRVK